MRDVRYWCSVVFAWKYWVYFALLILALLVGLIMVITPGGTQADLLNALLLPGPPTGITITSIVIQSQNYTGAAGQSSTTPGNGPSYGTFTNASNTYGMPSPGIIISTGKAQDYGDGPDLDDLDQGTDFHSSATAPQIALLLPIGGVGGSWFDVTQIDVHYTLNAARDTVFFNVVFGSNEYPEFVGPGFVDSFGLYVNGTNIAFSGGQPVNINNSAFAAIAGTKLNGVLAPGGVPLLQFSRTVGHGVSGVITFIISDMSDGIFDTTAYIGGLNAGGILVPTYQTANSGGLNMPPCIRGHAPVEQSRIAAVDWSELSRRMDAMRPEPLPETQWKERG